MRLSSQLIKGISRVHQKLFKYFNGTIISTIFLPPSSVSAVISCFNLNEALLLLVAEKLAIAPAPVKVGSSLLLP